MLARTSITRVIVGVTIVGSALALSASPGTAQPTPTARSLCDSPEYRGTAAYNYYCVSYVQPRSQVQPTTPAPRLPASQPPGPNLVLEDGKWSPQDGYEYITHDDDDYRVKWVPGRRSEEHPDCVASGEEGIWQPADGYEWLNDVRGDYRVMWVPGSHSKEHPHVVAREHVGWWRPEDGYMWMSEPQLSTDYRVVVDHKVADALRAASVVVRLPEQLGRIQEFWGFKEYNYDRVTAALQIMASGWIVDMPLAADRRQREILIDHAIMELKDALRAALSTTVEEILVDMKKLTPFKWNPFGAEQRELIARMAADTRELQRRGQNDIDSGASFTTIRSGSRTSAIQYNSGQAFQQLLEINGRRRWAD